MNPRCRDDQHMLYMLCGPLTHLSNSDSVKPETYYRTSQCKDTDTNPLLGNTNPSITCFANDNTFKACKRSQNAI